MAAMTLDVLMIGTGEYTTGEIAGDARFRLEAPRRFGEPGVPFETVTAGIVASRS